MIREPIIDPKAFVNAVASLNAQLEKDEPFRRVGATVIYRKSDRMPHKCGPMPGLDKVEHNTVVRLQCDHAFVFKSWAGWEREWIRVRPWMVVSYARVLRVGVPGWFARIGRVFGG